MTDSKHTPGPWTYEKSSVVFNTFPHTIGFHDGSGGCLDQNWSEADARLMAAAPELLEVARDVLKLFAYQGEDSSGLADLVEAKARAVIAKAEGK